MNEKLARVERELREATDAMEVVRLRARRDALLESWGEKARAAALAARRSHHHAFLTNEDERQFRANLTAEGQKKYLQHPYGEPDAEIKRRVDSGESAAWSAGYNHAGNGMKPHQAGLASPHYRRGYEEGLEARSSRQRAKQGFDHARAQAQDEALGMFVGAAVGATKKAVRGSAAARGYRRGRDMHESRLDAALREAFDADA